MEVDAIVRLIESRSTAEIALHLAEALDTPSPLIGARGPTEAGPERAYVQAAKRVSPAAKTKVGEAINALLLQDATDASRDPSGFPRPLLTFNLLVLLETVPMQEARPALGAYKQMGETLRPALDKRGADLYRQALLALAANQEPSGESDFWRYILRTSSLEEYIDVAEAGLRNAGWEVACQALVDLQAVYKQHPEIGSFDTAVMTIVDSYPDANWPTCASEFIIDHFTGPAILDTIRQYSVDRHDQPLSEVPRPPGSAIEDFATRRGERGLVQTEKRHGAWARRPDSALTGR